MKHVIYRFMQMLAIVVVLSVALFALLSAMPGNPVDMLIMSNPRVKPEDVVRLKKLRGLDKPWYVQYVRWIWGYDEPFRPPTVDVIAPVTLELDSQGKARAKIDLGSALHDSNFRLPRELVEQMIAANRPGLWQNIQSDASIRDASETEVVDMILERVSIEDDAFHQSIRTELGRRSQENLAVEGLFGATTNGFTLEQEFETPGWHRIWFVVRNREGLETVGSVAVEIKLPHTKGAKPIEEPLAIRPIPSQIIDDPKNFNVDLSLYVMSADSQAGNYRYELLAGSPGTIDSKGHYTHVFDGRGQKAIFFAVHDNLGNSAKAAFSVELEPLPDPSRFSRGFIFVFAGDKNALGFSSTYKRPVWELLAGPPSACGDGRVDPGESCDDGNLDEGDGCSSSCQTEGMSIWAKAQSYITGVLVSSGRIGNTLQLMIPAILLSLLIALPLGILSAYRQYSWLDYIVNFFAFIGISLPVFWFGIMVMYLFAENLQWFPAGGVQTPGIQDEGLYSVFSDRLQHAILPTLVLSIAYIGRWLRYMRASMLEILPADYIRTARAKGLGETMVVLKHALRNALIPVVTVLALSIPALFGGAVLTETVFSWPGIGRLEYDAIANSDYYVAIVVFLISSVLVMVGNLLADLLYVIVDPRIRHG